MTDLDKRSINNKVEKLEQITGKSLIVVAVKDLEGVKVNGVLMSEKEFEQFQKALPSNSELHIVEIVENKPPQR